MASKKNSFQLIWGIVLLLATGAALGPDGLDIVQPGELHGALQILVAI